MRSHRTGLRGMVQSVGLRAVWSRQWELWHQSIVNARSRLGDEVFLICTKSQTPFANSERTAYLSSLSTSF